MTNLFVRFYVGILVVLLLAWYVHGYVSEMRSSQEFGRVVELAHKGSARLVANELNAVLPDHREAALAQLRQRYDYPVNIVSTTDLPEYVQGRLDRAEEVVFFGGEGVGSFVVTPLQDGTEAVLLGPLPEFTHIEQSLRGGVRLAIEKLNAADDSERNAALDALHREFGYPVEIVGAADIPPKEQGRLAAGDEIAFYGIDGRSYLVAPISSEGELIRFGPLPRYGDVERTVWSTTLALTLVLIAVAIALLLRPVARHLRRIEGAAKAIAAGDLTARVDERRMHAAKPLADAFNQMATRVETLLRTQRELLQAVSHELRTPLSRIRFATDLVENAKSDEERRQRLRSLEAATDDLDELVDELLNYIRNESVDSDKVPEPVVVEESLEVLIQKYAALYPSLQFNVGQQSAQDSHYVVVDRPAFLRSIGNLLSNAARYAKSRVDVEIHQEGDFLTIDINDDGVGIPSDERDRVLEPFVQLNKESNGGSVGLGLAVVNRIVTQHGGTVEVSTSPQGGCRMRTTWPRRESALAAQ